MFVTSSSQEIRKYSMFAAIFNWDYPPLHQPSAELVLCGLLTHTHTHPNTPPHTHTHNSDIYFFLTFHQLWVIWEKSVKGELSVLFSFATRAFFREMVNSLFPLFPDFLSVLGVFEAVFNPSKNLL